MVRYTKNENLDLRIKNRWEGSINITEHWFISVWNKEEFNLLKKMKEEIKETYSFTIEKRKLSENFKALQNQFAMLDKTINS